MRAAQLPHHEQGEQHAAGHEGSRHGPSAPSLRWRLDDGPEQRGQPRDRQDGAHRVEARSGGVARLGHRSEEHTSELQSLMRISYAVFRLNKKNTNSASCTTYEHET